MGPDEEVIIRGIPISKGIGIGYPLFFSGTEEEWTREILPQKEIEQEISRFQEALEKSREELEHLQQISLVQSSPEVKAILGAHLEMMKDPLITHDIEQKIRETHQNTESIFHDLIEEFKKRFSSLKDPYFQERIRDIIDISRRILTHLRPAQRMKMTEVPQNTIILAHDLVPSETVEANASFVSAFVTAAGGVTSHAAIIARAKGIPYVANIDLKRFKYTLPQSLIVDGAQGLVIINPSRSTLKKYRELQDLFQIQDDLFEKEKKLSAETSDGHPVRIFANLENPKEVDSILQNGASGIGLFRSEYLCLAKKVFPSEEEQFQIYKKMAKALKGNPLVIRIFDLGGDKKMDVTPDSAEAVYFASIGSELNPALGCRAIRFLMRFPQILESQLRAILRASAFGQIHLLIPMVSDLSELRFVRSEIERIRPLLQQEGRAVAENIPVGCMIEVPSAALMSDLIAQEADFLSIGTNDLVQYVLAADRSNPNTSDLYFSSHPSVLRLIRLVVSHAYAAQKPVIVCGEIAADPLMIPVLLGFGISDFSVAARHIPLAKHTVRKWSLADSCKLAEGALNQPSSAELKQYLS